MSVDPLKRRRGRLTVPGGLGPAAVAMAAFIALLWAIEVLDVLLGHRLDNWGISPRDPRELPDIVTAPFLHAGFGHLAANTLPLFVLGLLAAVRGLARFLAVSALIVAVSGLGVWLISPPGTVTLGASGLVFGYFSYVVLRGFLDGNPVDIAIGVVVALVYGSLLWGVLPVQAGVSWQGHLFGLIGGAVAAWVFRSRRVAQAR
jgi:membrane associated rhomboid family serine protease